MVERKQGGKNSSAQAPEISRRLDNLRKYIPSCFIRRPHGQEEVDKWKAIEFQQFLLYTGFFVG